MAEGTGILDAVNQAPGQEPSEKTKEYISNGMTLIHSPDMQETIVERLQGDDDTKALSDLTLLVINRLDSSMEGAGAKIGEDVKIQGASIFLTQLVEVGEAAGVVDASEDDIKKAAGLAIGGYMKEGLAKGTITEDQMRDMYKMIQADNPGKEMVYNKEWTPGIDKSSVKIPTTSPGPSVLAGGA